MAGFTTLWGLVGGGSVGTDAAEASSSFYNSDLHALKNDIIGQVRSDAHANGERPTLEQYRQTFMESPQIKALVEQGVIKPENLAAVAADLKNQDLNGFKLTEPKIAKNYDGYDLDGDGQINAGAVSEFYDSITLTGASLRDALVDPATSFNNQIAKAKDLDNITFNRMQNGESFTFAAGQYSNIQMTNVDGGTIAFAPGTQVDGISLSGKRAEITIGANARIDKVQADEPFRIVTLNMAPGSILANSDLGEATVSMNSQLRGATLQNVTLNGNVSDLDCSSVTLNNVIIGKKLIRSREDLAELNISVDANTRVSTTQSFAQAFQMENALGAISVKDLAQAIAIKPPQPNTAPAIEKNPIIDRADSTAQFIIEHNTRVDARAMLAQAPKPQPEEKTNIGPATDIKTVTAMLDAAALVNKDLPNHKPEPAPGQDTGFVRSLKG